MRARLHFVPTLILAIVGLGGFAPDSLWANSVPQVADVGVTLSAQPQSVEVGQPITYTMVVVNNGPGTASALRARTSLTGLAGAKIRQATPSQGTCDLAVTGSSVHCRFGSVPAQTMITVTLVASSPKGGKLTATAATAAYQQDPNPGNQQASQAVDVIESTPPVNVIIQGADRTQPFQARSPFLLLWAAADPDSGVAYYDVRYRSAAPRQPFGPYVTFMSKTTAKSTRFSGRAGNTYCFSVRATDQLGNVSLWSQEWCTALPTIVTAFRATGGWHVEKAPQSYGGAFAIARKPQAALVFSGISARRIALLVRVCSRCGTVSVSLGSRLLASVSTRSATPAVRLIPVATFGSLKSGDLVIKVTSAHRSVHLNGVAISRV